MTALALVRRSTMCCWCFRVYCTVLHNLLARFCDNVSNAIYNTDCCCLRCCQHHCQKHTPAKLVADRGIDSTERGLNSERSTANLEHEYVIVDEADADYLEIERRKIETEFYYRTVDRAMAEDILSCREDGACLVRPYKEADISIKYIVSICAQQQYFHLFVRQIGGRELYGIGQEKANERLFSTPSDIIEFYSYNTLQCTNKSTSLSLVLKPIIA